MAAILLSEARIHVKEARAQETADGDALTAARHYTDAIECILRAIHSGAATQRTAAVLRPKLEAYAARAALLHQVAMEEESEPQIPTRTPADDSCSPLPTDSIDVFDDMPAADLLSPTEDVYGDAGVPSMPSSAAAQVPALVGNPPPVDIDPVVDPHPVSGVLGFGPPAPEVAAPSFNIDGNLGSPEGAPPDVVEFDSLLLRMAAPSSEPVPPPEADTDAAVAGAEVEAVAEEVVAVAAADVAAVVVADEVEAIDAPAEFDHGTQDSPHA